MTVLMLFILFLCCVGLLAIATKFAFGTPKARPKKENREVGIIATCSVIVLGLILLSVMIWA